MTAKTTTGKLFTGKRPWVWVLAFFGVVLVVMAIVWLIRRSKQTQQQAGNGNQAPGTQFPPYNPAPSTSTPPYVPKNNPNNPNNPSNGGGVNPNDMYNVNWAYVQDLAWKMYDTYFDRGGYKCEITNGIIEMGANDLRALNETYQKWYNRNLKTDYCQKIQSSGCWTSMWDDKPAKACNRLNNLN